MGMFDIIDVPVELLPVSDEEKDLLRDESWQTKDFRRELSTIYITSDGRLEVDHWYNEETKPREVVAYNGSFNFYTDVEGEWYQFQATYDNGRLQQIKRVKNTWTS